MLGPCDCRYAYDPIDSELTRQVASRYEYMQLAMEYWRCRTCDTHIVTMMFNGVREHLGTSWNRPFPVGYVIVGLEE